MSLIASGCVAVPLEASHSPSHHSSGSGSGFYTNTARKAHGNRNGNGYQEEELDVVECLWEFDETMVNTRREASHQHPRGHGHSNNHTRKMPLYNNGAYNTTSPGSYRNGDTATARLSPGTAFTSMSPGPRNARGRTYVRIPLRSVAICILAGMRLARVLRELRHGKRRQKASFEGLADWNGFSSDVSSGIGIGAGTSNSNGSDSDIGVIGAGDGSPGVDNEQYKVYCRKLLSHYIIPPKYQLQRCPTESSLAQLVIDRAEEHDGMLSGIVFDSDYNGEYRPSLLELLTGAKGKTHPGLEMARGMYNYDMFGLGVLARVEETMVSMSRSLVDLRAKEALFQVSFIQRIYI